jgi:glycosyltransferase involved in cell wall biosynthesis
MNSPLVSIITPSYNQGDFIEETILSVLNQTYKNIEYIIIDGGSNDNSVDVIKKYQSKLTYWVSEKDEGQADAINKGFKKASGEYLCWINSDDLLYSDFIEKRIKEFEMNPGVDLIYGDVDQGASFDEKVLRKGKQINFNSVLKSAYIPIPQQSAIWKNSIIYSVGQLNVKWQVLLDFDYFLRIVKTKKIKYITGSVAFFRNHGESKSVKQKKMWIKELELYSHESNLRDLISNKNDIAVFNYSIQKWIYDLSIEINDEFIKTKYKSLLLDSHKIKYLSQYLKSSITQFLVKLKKVIYA